MTHPKQSHILGATDSDINSDIDLNIPDEAVGTIVNGKLTSDGTWVIIRVT